MSDKLCQIKQYLPLAVGLMGIVVIVALMPQAVKYLTRASGTPANLVINYEGLLGTMPKIWRNLAQGGEEPKAMLAGVMAEVKALQPEYIRIDHIYDAFNVVNKQEGKLNYNWNGLDEAVGEIMATGAKPFLVLSYMPTVLSGGSMVDVPRDFNEWGSVVQATIEHYSGRNEKNIEGVIYEVWNEPDLFGGYKTYGDKNYLNLYDASARAAMRAQNVNRFEIGGPASTAPYATWVQNLIKYVDQNNLRMDFVSWHRYSTSIDQFEVDVKQVQDWAQKIPALANLKYYVTEWGHNSENDAGYDNKFGAIHTLAGVRAMMGRADRAFIFEIKDGPGKEKYWKRWGLLTNEKWGEPEKKPRYGAVQFLNSLLKFRVGLSGEGSFVRAIASEDEEGKLKALVINYDADGSHSETVPITFENLPKGNFMYTRQDFLGGSKGTKIATSEASWKTVEYMAPNSAMMVSLDF